MGELAIEKSDSLLYEHVVSNAHVRTKLILVGKVEKHMLVPDY